MSLLVVFLIFQGKLCTCRMTTCIGSSSSCSLYPVIHLSLAGWLISRDVHMWCVVLVLTPTLIWLSRPGVSCNATSSPSHIFTVLALSFSIFLFLDLPPSLHLSLSLSLSLPYRSMKLHRKPLQWVSLMANLWVRLWQWLPAYAGQHHEQRY